MTSLFEQLAAERASGEVTTLRDWQAEHPPPDSVFSQTIAGIAHRMGQGEELRPAVRELLDEIVLITTPHQVERAISERPETTGDRRADAYLGALAEHLALVHQVARPRWVDDPDRFLDRFWFVSRVRGFRALAIAESPAAFRRRGVFISRGSLERC